MALALPVLARAQPPWAARLTAVQRSENADRSRTASATCPSTGTTTEAILKDALALLESGEPVAAAPCFESVEARAVSEGDAAAEGRAALGLAQALYAQGEYARIEQEADRALAIFERRGERLQAARSRRLKATAAAFRNESTLARQLYESAIAEFQELGAGGDEATALIGLEGLGGPTEQRLTLIDRALSLARAAGDMGTEGHALHSRSDTQFAAGRFDAALADLDLAVERLRQAGDQRALADAYVSLGRLYRAHGEPERAIASYDRAIEIQETLKELRGLVQSLNARAIALARLDRKDESRRAYERAYEIAVQTGSSRLLSFAGGNLAAVYVDAGDHARAVALLTKSLEVERSPYVLAYRHGTLAKCHLALGELGAAHDHVQKAVDLAREPENREYLVLLQVLRARIRRRLGRHDEALLDAREAVAAIEELRARLVPLDFLKRGFADRHQATFGLTIALMLDRGEVAESLVVAEQARARAFLDLLAARRLDALSTASGQATGTLLAEAVQKELPLASDASVAPAAVSEIAETARRLRSTILSYWVDEEDLVVWVVSPGGAVRAKRVAVTRAQLEEVVAASTPRLSGANRSALVRLCRWLVEPVAQWLPAAGGSLLVIPHGSLFRVPFAALLDARGRYLVERFGFSYAPSVSTLSLTGRLAGRGDGAAGVLLVSDPRPTPAGRDGRPLPALPAATREVASIRRALSPMGTTTLSGADATEPAVRSTIGGKRAVHFATHSVMDDDAPTDSFLALGRRVGPESAGDGHDDPLADGRLTVAEMYALSLDADLVFVSACRSATGRRSDDGITGMSRALFYAGAPSVIATLWDVADEPSAVLVADFYRRWRGGTSKRSALRGAQLRMIRKLRERRMTVTAVGGRVRLADNPFYWAPYVLLGEP